jgi:hypothetical protein
VNPFERSIQQGGESGRLTDQRIRLRIAHERLERLTRLLENAGRQAERREQSARGGVADAGSQCEAQPACELFAFHAQLFAGRHTRD